MSEFSCRIGTAVKEDILTHFNSCDENFILALSAKVNLDEYADKILANAIFYEAWDGQSLVGLIAIYSNPKFDFITNVSISKKYEGQGIASRLLREYLRNRTQETRLEVAKSNEAAQQLYKKCGFELYDQNHISDFLKLPAFFAE